MSKAIPDGVVVSVPTDEDAYRVCVGVPSQAVVHQGDVEVELAGVLGLELPGFEFDDVVAQLLDVEEEQVDVEVIPANIKVHSPTDERESRTELAECFGDAVHEGLLKGALSDVTTEAEKFERVGIFRDLLG
jgi:hypothetical protein